MTTHTGYLLIADITGYTKFLTSSEMDHANAILHSLLEALIEQIGDPLHFWKMEGDAVLAYSTRQQFPSGETFLAICENLYNSFAQRQQDIIANTTCTCNACANTGDLDLKIIAHYGRFEEMKLGPNLDISGPDVILVHRMTKTDVKEKTGIHSYALFSDAAAQAMNIRHFDAPAAVVWEALVAPEHKQRWMDNIKTVTAENLMGRVGNGSTYHCAHALADFIYTVTDWEPFIYFSTRILDPARPGVSLPETYHLTQTNNGTEVRYTMGRAEDADGNRYEESEENSVAFLSEFWPASFDEMEVQLKAAN